MCVLNSCIDYRETSDRNKDFMEKLKINLQPSGLNTRFYGEGLPFADYIELMRNIIIESRDDLTSQNAAQIVNDNSPFCLRSDEKKKYKNGVLLVHGLYDSPFFLRDIGQYFFKKDFLVNSILLPGHGTVPGDLLEIKLAEWLKAVTFGIESLSDCDNIFIAGYSLGGMLAIHHRLTHTTPIKGLFLFAPALKTRSFVKSMMAKYHRLFSWHSQTAKWYQIRKPLSYVKYNCYAFNAGYQTCKLMDITHKLLAQQSIDIPIFVVISADDETLSDRCIIDFFLKQPHKANKCVLYSNKKSLISDDRIIHRESQFSEKKILNFSHTCLTISPENVLLGEKSDYQDFSHYVNFESSSKNDIYQGAITKENLKQYTISRLSYNPDFYSLLHHVDEFLMTL